MNWMKRIFEASIFSPLPLSAQPSAVIASLFHRSAATLYLIYSFWGIAALLNASSFFTLAFSCLVIPVALAACFGATFFSRFGRLEMYATSALVVLILIFQGYTVIQLIMGENRWAGFILNYAHLVIPVARATYVYLTLIHKAKGRYQ